MKKPERKVLSFVLMFLAGSSMIFAGGGQQGAGAAGGKKTIALLPPAMISPFYASVIKGAKEVADKMGYNLTTLAPDSESNYSAQVQIMEDLITKKVDGIMVCAINQEAISAGVKKANDAGIPVVFFNTNVDLKNAVVYAMSGYDQYNGGGRLADWVNTKTGGNAKVAIIEGLPSDYTTLRMGGFVDRCKEKYPGIQLVASQTGDWEREKGMNAATNMLQAHPEITVIYGLSDEMALGAYQAKKQAGRNDVIVIGLDGNPNALESVKNGELDATLNCGPVDIGRNAVIYMDKAIKKESIPQKFIEAETIVVDKTNVDQFLN
jgi:ribose transport system substrate-binding protein